MKKTSKQSMLMGIISVVIFLVLSSFAFKRGGDSYTIWVNGKQLIQHYVASKNPLPSLSINSKSTDKISVYYSQCGKIGTSRKLSVRNEKGKILKEWAFADVLNEHTPMTFQADELSELKDLGLYYQSAEEPDPRKLVSLIMNVPASASR